MSLRWSKLLRSSSHLQCTPLSFLSLWQPTNLLQLPIERRNFLHRGRKMYKVVFCWIVLQFSSRLLKVTFLSHTMCHVLSATLDTIIELFLSYFEKIAHMSVVWTYVSLWLCGFVSLYLCNFVFLYVRMFVARACKVEGTMSWCSGTNEILASI